MGRTASGRRLKPAATSQKTYSCLPEDQMNLELHVSPTGPVRTLAQACDWLRQRQPADAPAAVWLHGGRYPLDEPLVLAGPAFNGVTFAAVPGETPILDGGTPLTGWRET